MDFLPENIQTYSEKHTSEEARLLYKISHETHQQVLSPRMLSGHLQGRLLAMIAYMIKPTSILEIGTYTGYSAICLAEGLAEQGMLHTIDINDELEQRVRAYFKEANIERKIKYHIGDALEIIPQLDISFDLVFIDADKINYSKYYDLTFDKLKRGGFVLVDNVLWSGKVADQKVQDKTTLAIRDFNQKIQADTRIENILLPLRDGLMLLRKK